MIEPLIRCKIPITVFKDGPETAKPTEEHETHENVMFVHQNKWTPNGRRFFGTFHSKLMLFEFDDRLRVVVTSANIYRVDWEMMSNVIWF